MHFKAIQHVVTASVCSDDFSRHTCKLSMARKRLKSLLQTGNQLKYNERNNYMSILIVDDSQDSLQLLGHILKDAGYKDIILAQSPAEAFRVLRMDDPSCADVPVDLILMDVIMPETDGIEACRKIKKCDNLKDIPLIMITVMSNIDTLQAAFDAGAIDYISKPYRKIELLARIRSMLKLNHEIKSHKASEQKLREMALQLEASNKLLEHLSYRDSLTGIANRRYLEEFIEQEWKRAVREVYPISLIFVDIDHFKAFNDAYGHPAGDECLRQIARALTNSIKRPADIIARYGGEEFIAVLPGTDAAGAFSVAELMKANVVGLGIEHASSQVINNVSVSIGVATALPDRYNTPSSLIANADKALYKAKSGGRNRVAMAT
ncbi:MAG: diguanylate cyclase [Candidatus Brocadiaceae bacterium]